MSKRRKRLLRRDRTLVGWSEINYFGFFLMCWSTASRMNSLSRKPFLRAAVVMMRASALETRKPKRSGFPSRGINSPRKHHHTSHNIASAYALMDEPEQAMKWLQVTADEGFPNYLLFEGDAQSNKLRNDPRFIALMAQQKQRWERFSATL